MMGIKRLQIALPTVLPDWPRTTRVALRPGTWSKSLSTARPQVGRLPLAPRARGSWRHLYTRRRQGLPLRRRHEERRRELIDCVVHLLHRTVVSTRRLPNRARAITPQPGVKLPLLR